MIYIIIIIILIFVLLILLEVWGRLPQKHKNIHQNELNPFFNSLLEIYSNNSILLIEHKPSKKFLQFRKIIRNKHDYMILDFPDAKWSESYVDNLITEFNKNNIEFSFLDINEGNLKRMIQTKEMEDSKDALLITKITLRVLEIDENDSFVVQLKGMPKEKYLIGVPFKKRSVPSKNQSGADSGKPAARCQKMTCGNRRMTGENDR